MATPRPKSRSVEVLRRQLRRERARRSARKPAKADGPRVLLLDIETAPILAHVWGRWEQNVGLNQIKADWFILAWAAKWLDDPPESIIYMDQSKARRLEDDRLLLKGIWKLLDQADVVITQNGIHFDIKKLNARFILNGMGPTKPVKHIDTKVLAQRYFGFTSTKLEYLSQQLCRKYRKLKHPKFEGFELWSECLKGNQAAWREMKKYNCHDVLALEELYHRLAPWDGSVRFDWYREGTVPTCNCGSTQFKRRGFRYTAVSKRQAYQCVRCGCWTQGRENLFDKKKRDSLRGKA